MPMSTNDSLFFLTTRARVGGSYHAWEIAPGLTEIVSRADYPRVVANALPIQVRNVE